MLVKINEFTAGAFLCLVLYKHSPKLLYCSLASYAYFCYNEKVMD